jgi:hypothetical protein
MKYQTSGFWRGLVLTAGIISCQATLPIPAIAQTTKRPISDFISTQGTFCLPDGHDGCTLFQPPVPNYLASTAPPPPANASGRCGSVDYAGVADRWLVSQGGPSLNTEFSGTITERALDDGRAEVMVLLHTGNALSWFVDNLACDAPPLGRYSSGTSPLTYCTVQPRLWEALFFSWFSKTLHRVPLCPISFNWRLPHSPARKSFSLASLRKPMARCGRLLVSRMVHQAELLSRRKEY